MEEMITIQSAESCGHKRLHSTREELREKLAAECVIHECGDHWGREKKQRIELICDSDNTMKKMREANNFYFDPHVAEADLVLAIDRSKK